MQTSHMAGIFVFICACVLLGWWAFNNNSSSTENVNNSSNTHISDNSVLSSTSDNTINSDGTSTSYQSGSGLTITDVENECKGPMSSGPNTCGSDPNKVKGCDQIVYDNACTARHMGVKVFEMYVDPNVDPYSDLDIGDFVD